MVGGKLLSRISYSREQDLSSERKSLLLVETFEFYCIFWFLILFSGVSVTTQFYINSVMKDENGKKGDKDNWDIM
jgi:hypothetical protein